MSAIQLSSLCSTWLGDIETYLTSYGEYHNSENVQVKLAMCISLLEENIPYAISISKEILKDTLFNQRKEILLSLKQIKSYMERDFISNGNDYAAKRVASYYSLEGACGESYLGISYYQFICNILDNFDEEYENLINKLRDLLSYIFKSNTFRNINLRLFMETNSCN